MVGVAGKSKACHDCKRRRVKCDFERPACRRCAKAGIECSGYAQEVVFVNRSIDNPTVSAPSVLARSKIQSIQEELDELVSLSQTPESSVRFRAGVFKLLQKLYLPQPEVESDTSDHCAPFTWFRAVCELEKPCLTLNHALVSFCTVQVLVTNTGNVTREQAWERYHETLGYLSAALNDNDPSRYVHILASILVLSTNELFLCPTDDGMRVHVQGIADLLRLRKGCSHVSPEIRARLFSRLRIISVLQQLTCHQPGPVSPSRWASLMAGDTALDPLDTLFDIASRLPRTLASASHLFSQSKPLVPSQPPKEDIFAVTTSLWSTLRDIYTWQDTIRSSSPTPPYTAVPSRLTNPSDTRHGTPLFPFALEFRSIQIATLHVCSWGFQLHTLLIISRLSSSFHSSVPPAGPSGSTDPLSSPFLPLHSVCDEADKLARLLCQSIEYCHRVEMGTFGPQTMVYSQWVLRHYFGWRGAVREAEWCAEVERMRGEGTWCGIGLLRLTGELL
ncbi:hypothetical protein EJ05DRAFT_533985 [Pseudovirgaria hyperparasitica]|uniref:Zn(2)-C6 fungal-type domain-containing protein n=1 Tax=Pseudovirgaria hyperparasitica TaxID=470096 RepID=A0A6A6WJL4_9PEZI|nr:uncharacterized protein EJ05DRAFT_533985 [Pseudovirgaria hyperparasitica]KAF2762426.1 hypothetical protein EJ05DRAFT_533985 [Pseudovirgaria hyperparasitica]